MSVTSRLGDEPVPLALALRIEEIYSRFESAWSAGRRPQIEDFVGELPEGPGRPALLAELLALDLRQRRRAGETPTLEEYRQRLPRDAALVDRVFREEDGEKAGPGPGAAQFSVDSGAETITAREAVLPSDPTKRSPEQATPAAPPMGTRGKRIRCPHCCNPIHLVDERPDEVLCPACGSSFRVQDTQATTTTSEMRQLGKFQLLERVGLGACGAVWRARDTELGRIVALKLPHASLLSSPRDLERFYREARAAAQLRHPGIVTVHEVATLDGLPALVSDFIAGATLRSLLQVRGLTFRESAKLVAELAEALDYAHAMGLVHRDIKPANIMMEPLVGSPLSVAKEQGTAAADYGLPTTDSGLKPLLMDFGLALRQEAEITMTLEGQIIGTPAYMSPEQAAGRGHRVDGRSDIYSLGVVLYELLTGELPFRGSKQMIVHQVLYEEPRPPRRLKDKIPRDLETVCLKAMAKAPGRRYATARELADDLRRYLGGEAIRARPVGAWERAWIWAKRRPAAAALVGVSLLATVLLVAVLAVSNIRVSESLRGETEAKGELANTLARERATAERERETAYLQRIALARRESQANNVVGAEEILDQCPRHLRAWEWHYLKRLCQPDAHRTLPHGGGAKSVAFSPDGQRIASGGGGAVRVWDAATGQELLSLRGVGGSVTFSPDGKQIASAGGVGYAFHRLGEIKIWDAKTGNELRTIRAHVAVVVKVTFSPDGMRLASAGSADWDKDVKIWDVGTGLELLTIPAGPVNGVGWSLDGRRLATGSADNTVKTWDAKTGQAIRTLTGHTAAVASVVYSLDGRKLASASNDQTIKVWDAETGQELLTIRGHLGPVQDVAFSPDGQRLASASRDWTVRIWDAINGNELRSLRGHRLPPSAVAYSPDGKRIASANPDVKIWDATIAPERYVLRGHSGQVYGVAFSPNGKRLASAGGDARRTADPGEVRVWDTQTGQTLLPLRTPWGVAKSVAFSPDGKRLASSGGDPAKPFEGGEATVWDATTGQKRFSFRHSRVLGNVAFSPDGKYLASGSFVTREPNVVIVWDLTTGQKTSTIEGHTTWVTDLAFSPDGSRLASAGGMVLISDVPTGREIYTMRPGANAIAFSPDGKRLASVDFRGIVSVRDTTTGQEISTGHGHTRGGYAIAFSPDGRRLATGSDDNTVKVWDVQTGQEVITLQGHSKTVFWVTFSRDGHRLASGSGDGTVRIWDGTPLEEKPDQSAAGSPK